MPTPLVSALMVTRNRAALARVAIHCFAAQPWARKELVIIDDGTEDYEPVVAPYRDRITVQYIDGDLFTLPAFRLTVVEREAAARFLAERRLVGIATP